LETVFGVRHGGESVTRGYLFVYDVLQLSSQFSSCVASVFSF